MRSLPVCLRRLLEAFDCDDMHRFRLLRNLRSVNFPQAYFPTNDGCPMSLAFGDLGEQ